MILVAGESALVEAWQQALAPFFPLFTLVVNDSAALQACLKKETFRVLLLDFSLLGPLGIEEIATLKELQPQGHLVLMTSDPQPQEEIGAILFGAKAYCHVRMDPHLLPKVIKTVLNDELWVDRQFVSRLLQVITDITQARHQEVKQLDKRVALMTQREMEVACWVARGASNKKIADRLHICERTVKAHLGVIFRKMGLCDRLQLALYMNKHQQLSPLWHKGSA